MVNAVSSVYSQQPINPLDILKSSTEKKQAAAQSQSAYQDMYIPAVPDSLKNASATYSPSASARINKAISMVDSASRYLDSGKTINLKDTESVNQLTEASTTELSKQEKKEMMDLLKQADVNGDGQVTREELDQLKEKLLAKLEEQQKMAISKMVEEALFNNKLANIQKELEGNANEISKQIRQIDFMRANYDKLGGLLAKSGFQFPKPS